MRSILDFGLVAMSLHLGDLLAQLLGLLRQGGSWSTVLKSTNLCGILDDMDCSCIVHGGNGTEEIKEEFEFVLGQDEVPWLNLTFQNATKEEEMKTSETKVLQNRFCESFDALLCCFVLSKLVESNGVQRRDFVALAKLQWQEPKLMKPINEKSNLWAWVFLLRLPT